MSKMHKRKNYPFKDLDGIVCEFNSLEYFLKNKGIKSNIDYTSSWPIIEFTSLNSKSDRSQIKHFLQFKGRCISPNYALITTQSIEIYSHTHDELKIHKSNIDKAIKTQNKIRALLIEFYSGYANNPSIIHSIKQL